MTTAGEVAASFTRVAARDRFVRANGGRWRPDAVFERNDSAVLRVPRGSSTMVVGSGEVGEVVGLVRDHAAELGDVRFAILPYGTHHAHPGEVEDALGLEVYGPWEWLWCRTPPPARPGEEHVRPLDGVPQEDLVRVLERANPDSISWPGDPGLTWWGYVRDGALLGVCALILPEAGRGQENGVHLSGAGVLPEARRQGIGGAMMAAITRWGLERHGLVHFGVWLDNDPALRLYRRLGFTTGAWVQSYIRR